MKAAVLHRLGELPRYEDFPEPLPADDEVLIEVKAVGLENVDRMMAAGTHYAGGQFLNTLPAIVGFDGIGTLPDGTLVGFGGTRAPYGAMAQRTVAPKTNIIPIPEGIDAVTAAAFPSALSAFAMKFAGGLQPGGTVLIHGATGVSGRTAIRVAKLLGAGRVVASGRDAGALKELKAIGADGLIDLEQSDEALVDSFKRAAQGAYDVVLDFVWGRPTEVLLRALTPTELEMSKRVRLVQVGEAAGPTLSLSAESLRTSGLEICGASAGITGERMLEATEQVTEWIRSGKLKFDVAPTPLREIEKVWQSDFRGRRIVIVP